MTGPVEAIWTLVGAMWAVTAPFANRARRSERTAARLTTAVPLVLGLVLLVGVGLHTPMLDRVVVRAAGLGTFVTATGAVLASWARLRLGKHWSGGTAITVSHGLVLTGPYRYVRHPMYAGLSLAALGSVITRGTPGACAGAALACCAWAIKMRREDKLLASEYGDVHAAYKRNVKALIPFVW